MAGAMIVSVGGTPAPLVFSLQQGRPDFVCFFTSQASVDQVADVKRALDFSFSDEKVLTENPEDLIECYRKALDCVERVRRRCRLEDTVVDYTGGTKVMSAALALAAASQRVRFAYVGGTRRTKEGLGTVESGSENRRLEVNPWQLFAVEEKRRIAQHFNGHQYLAAETLLSELLPSLPGPDRSLLEPIALAARAYGAWDRFDHNRALKALPGAREKLEERSRAAGSTEYDVLVQTMRDNVETLGALKKRRESLAGDLLANAERRMEEGKFDDAVARLYRVVEFLGQCAFEEFFKCKTDRVPVETLPEALREEFARKYAEGDKAAKLPLYATYRALAEAGHPIGRQFIEGFEEMRNVLSARNGSILAHGTDPIAESTARRLREMVDPLLPEDVSLPRFPKLPW
jgi:CRISPR-associated protein (TIGR02710 family)